jgi:hypothetical protein
MFPMKLKLIFGVVTAFLFAAGVLADGVSVTTSSPGWVQIAPNTFVLPANLSGIGCGTENEPTCEPVGVFNFNVAFATSGTFNILEEEDGLSDVINYFNLNGHGVVSFYSDPLHILLPDDSMPGTTLCVEDNENGCVSSFTVKTTNGNSINLTVASDGESSFDPLGAGYDTSDGFKVTTPEPGSFALVASGLLGLAGILRKKLLSR